MLHDLEYRLEGEDLDRFLSYEAARALHVELCSGASKGMTPKELAEKYELEEKDVEMVLYALHVRHNARN